jgi:hypothetical protein
MIPSFIDPQTSSPGEKEVFGVLKADAPADWTVLHSVNLPQHVRQLEGELDFLVLIPGEAAVCVEVKAHHKVSRDANGLWRMGNDAPVSKSPFVQASEAMHSLSGRLKAADPALGGIPFVSAVVFTHCMFDAPAAEWDSWQAIDEQVISQRGLASALIGVASNFRKKCLLNRAAWFRDEQARPTPEDCAKIAGRIRPAFEKAQSPKARRARTMEALDRFTREQFKALDALEMNPQVVFSGAAGTGKTYLALEAARRSAAGGKKTLLCCFNRMLGDWLKAQDVSADGAVEAGTLHSLMLKITGEQPGDSPPASFWDELPGRAEECLLADGSPWAGAFDVLVIDEAQDLLDKKYLDVLGLLLADGLASGSYRMFGDFDGQSIFTHEDGRQVLKEHSSPAHYALRENCRNQPPIGRLAASTSGLPNLYDRFRRPEDGATPDFKKYASADEQLANLDDSIDAVRAHGHQLGDIVILSTRADGAWKHLSPPNADRLSSATGVPGTKIRCGTVQGFKGLDAPAVIITDVDEVTTSYGRQLLYIACSRATERLIVHVAHEVTSDLIELVMQREVQNE